MLDVSKTTECGTIVLDSTLRFKCCLVCELTNLEVHKNEHKIHPHSSELYPSLEFFHTLAHQIVA
jgi:hypothetical protein